MTKAFPDGFLWGAATAPMQVEGNNLATDLWALEHIPDTVFAEPSGDTVDFYNRYPEDIATLAGLGLNALRFGVEWARIEPEAGQVSRAELDHYSRMVDTCLEHGVTPIVTLHHFSSPRWLLTRRGWKNPDTAKLFADQASRVVARLGDRATWYCTINEANTPMQLTGNGLLSPTAAKLLNPFRATAAAAFGVAPEDFAPFFPYADGEEAIAVVMEAHRLAVDAIHAANAAAQAGITLSMQEQHGEPGGEEEAARIDDVVNRRWLRETGAVGDFVGVQNYSRLRYDRNGRIPETEELSRSGLRMVPGSLAATVREAWEVTGKPILVTEHGTDLPTARDAERVAFTRASLGHLADAITDGVDVRGYIHWCLADNWEWFRGYHGQYGLFEVDRATQTRTPRPSAGALGAIARANAI